MFIYGTLLFGEFRLAFAFGGIAMLMASNLITVQKFTEAASLAGHLLKSRTQMVVAMSYSVTVSAAELMMRRLYVELFSSETLSSAITTARRDLHDKKIRRA